MNKDKGIFQLTMLALRGQISTLLDNSGGEKAGILLDKLAECSPAAQNKILDCFINVLNSSEELSSSALSDGFEENLFQDICSELEKGSIGTNFELIPGEACTEKDNIIDFMSASSKVR